MVIFQKGYVFLPIEIDPFEPKLRVTAQLATGLLVEVVRDVSWIECYTKALLGSYELQTISYNLIP